MRCPGVWGKQFVSDTGESGYDAFISYASADRAAVEDVVRYLESRGIRCWYAPRDIRPGAGYGEQITRGIRLSRTLIVLVSEAANASPNVPREVERAHNQKVTIFPVRLDDVELAGDLEYFVSLNQALNLFGEQRQANLARLAETVLSDISPPVGQDGKRRNGAPNMPSSLDSATVPSGRWLNRTFRVCAYILLAGVLLSVDLFGMNWFLARRSENILFSLLAPLYGSDWFGSRPPRAPGEAETLPRWNRNITVLQIDDRFLAENGLPWPVSRAVHARILGDLYANFKPDVIFVDILFMDEWGKRDEEGLQELEKLFRQINQAKETKLFLAGFDERKEKSRILPALAEEATLAAVHWPTGPRVNRSPLYYPLADYAGHAGSSDSASAAYAIYRYLCKKTESLNCTGIDDPEERFIRPMTVFWGIDPPDLNWEQSNRFRAPCNTVGTSFSGHFAHLLLGAFSGDDGDRYQDCPYVQLIKARDFYLPKKFLNSDYSQNMGDCELTPTGNGSTHDDVRKKTGKTGKPEKPFRCYEDVQAAYRAALTGNKKNGPTIVVYGVDVAGSQDVVDTPTHGPVDGVFLHAMALDNLLTMGEGYIRPCGFRHLSWLDDLFASEPGVPVPCAASGGLNAVSLGLTAFAVVICVLLTDLRYAAEHGVGAGRVTRAARVLLRLPFGSALWTGLSLAIVFCLILSAVLLLFFVERLAPANWIGIFGVALLVCLTDKSVVEKLMPQLIDLVSKRRIH